MLLPLQNAFKPADLEEAHLERLVEAVGAEVSKLTERVFDADLASVPARREPVPVAIVLFWLLPFLLFLGDFESKLSNSSYDSSQFL